MKYRFFSLLCLMTVLSSRTIDTTYVINPHSDQTIEIDLHIHLDEHEFLYRDSIILSTDHPNISITNWSIDQSPTTRFDTSAKKDDEGYASSIDLHIIITDNQTHPMRDGALHVTYRTTTLPCPHETIIPIVSASEPSPTTIFEQADTEASTSNTPPHPTAPRTNVSQYISDIIKKTDSIWVRLCLVFLLGVLLSLTPCIYPMIPITIGILNAQASNSMVRNFGVALCYTSGISFTYALFGILASMTGPIWGHLLSHPVFVVSLVGMLIYFALSMFDVYQINLPSLVKNTHHQKKYHNRFLSSFAFGAMSGMVASPCVSPGLALILTIVASLGNALLGFLFLFLFGAGLSMPLLIIGTFSTNLTIMPTAGPWMTEIKKVFGFLLLGLCFFYLQNILPQYLLLLLFSLFILAIGLYYFYIGQKGSSLLSRRIYTGIGTGMMVIFIILSVETVQETFFEPITDSSHTVWYTDYQEARAIAQKEGKKLFIDFWAQWCSICLTINNSTFKNPAVLGALEKWFIPIKINGTAASNQQYAVLAKQFNITGFPTFLIVDPDTQTIVKQWGSSIYSMPIDTFIQKLRAYA